MKKQILSLLMVIAAIVLVLLLIDGRKEEPIIKPIYKEGATVSSVSEGRPDTVSKTFSYKKRFSTDKANLPQADTIQSDIFTGIIHLTSEGDSLFYGIDLQIKQYEIFRTDTVKFYRIDTLFVYSNMQDDECFINSFEGGVIITSIAGIILVYLFAE